MQSMSAANILGAIKPLPPVNGRANPALLQAVMVTSRLPLSNAPVNSKKQVKNFKKLENKKIPEDFDYKKVKAAMRTRFANGAHYGAYAPLGYVKDPDKKGHLLICLLYTSRCV